MRLTAEQKNRIAAFLRKQDEQFTGLPADARVQALGEVKRRIRTEAAALGQDTVSDEQIESILGRMKISVRQSEPEEESVPEVVPEAVVEEVPEATVESEPEVAPDLKVEAPKWEASKAEAEPVVAAEPASAVEVTTEPNEDSEEEAVDYGDAHWLGVCSAIVDRQRISVNTLRIGFIVLGLLTGPIALILYCLVYLGDSFQHPHDYLDRSFRLAVWRVIRALVIAVALYATARLVLYGAGELYATYFTGAADLELFGRFSSYDGTLLNLLLLSSLPMSLLSGLPLAYKWDKTMGLLSNAALAMYAVFLSLGVSASLAGYLLSAFQEFRG